MLNQDQERLIVLNAIKGINTKELTRGGIWELLHNAGLNIGINELIKIIARYNIEYLDYEKLLKEMNKPL